MSFCTPWKVPMKADTADKTKTSNPPEPAPTCKEPPMIGDCKRTEGSKNMFPATGPSSPEGSKCTADVELQPNSSECPSIQGCNSSQIISSSMEVPNGPKPSERSKDEEQADGSNVVKSSDDSEQNLKNSRSSAESSPKCPKQSYVSEDSDVFIDGGNNKKSQECKGDNNKGSQNIDGKKNSRHARLTKISKSSKGSQKSKRNSVGTTRNKSSRGRKCVKRPRSSKKSEISGLNSFEDSTSSAEDGPRTKASKSSYKKYGKGCKNPEISKKKSNESEGSELSSLWDSTSSSEDESQRSSQMPSQAASLGSQFLKQEPLLNLSPPPAGLNSRDRLAWIQQRRITGVWVYCDNPECDKQRYLADVQDPAVLPDKWFCRMNKDPERNSCEAAEVGPGIAEEEDMITSAYTAGSLVWARLEGFPEWPAMIDDDPDYEQYYWCGGYSDIPTEYHVTFFDTDPVTRAWFKPRLLRRFTEQEAVQKFFPSGLGNFSQRLKLSHEQAVQALPLSPLERLRKFSFIKRYAGKIGTNSRKPTPPTPRRLLELQEERKKSPGQSGKPRYCGRPSQKEKPNKKKHGSQKKNRNKRVHTDSSCDSMEDDKDPYSFDGLANSYDKGPREKKSSKGSSPGSSKVAPKTFSRPNFEVPDKLLNPTSLKPNSVKSPSCKSLLVEPVLAKSPTSTYNTTTQTSTQRSRKLWLELDSSSESEGDCEPAKAAPLPAANKGRTGEMESFVSVRDKQVMFDDEPVSEDSIFAVAGSVYSFVYGKQPACKAQDSIHSDFIDNTPTDLPKVTRPSKVVAAPPDGEQALDASPLLEAKLSRGIGDTLPLASEDDDLTDMG